MTLERVSQFDIEQGIMNCWQVVDDLNMILEMWDSMKDEDRRSVLAGMAKLYQAKFDNLFLNKFEPFLRDNTIAARIVPKTRDLINDCNGDDLQC